MKSKGSKLSKIEIAVRSIFVLLTVVMNFIYMHSTTWPFIGGWQGRVIKCGILILMSAALVLFIRYVVYAKRTYNKADWHKSILTAAAIVPWVILVFFPYMIYWDGNWCARRTLRGNRIFIMWNQSCASNQALNQSASTTQTNHRQMTLNYWSSARESSQLSPQPTR